MSDQCTEKPIEERLADFIRAVKDGDRVSVSKVNAIGGWDSSHFNARYVQTYAEEIDRLRAENARLLEALAWYQTQVSGCNKHGPDGNMCRDALAKDKGQRARAVIQNKGDTNDQT